MHFRQSANILTEAVDTSIRLKVDADFVDTGAIGGIYGPGCEFISRNRGRLVPVAPLLYLRQGLWVWLGYHEEWEEWDEDELGHDASQYSFRSVGLSIHFGVRNNSFKPQMFRAEWAGCAKWTGNEYGFQANTAAHPHWQFDALESLPDDELSKRAEELLSRLSADAEPEVRDFSPRLSEVDVRDFVTSQKLSRVHFASAAAWWKAPPHNEHVHAPSNVVDIQNWVRHSLDYIKLELGRL